MEFSLKARPPFSLASVIRSHGWIRLAPFAELGDGAGLRTTIQLDSGRVACIRISEADGGVRVVAAEDLDKQESAQLAECVTWMLGLEQDLTGFYALCRDEPGLAHAESDAKGRMLRSPTLFEDIVKTMLTTNTSWSGTIRMTNALVQTYGAPANGVDDDRAFPLPAVLAQSGEADLRDTAKLGYRAPYVLELARRVASGDLDLDAFKAPDLSTPELRKRLLAIKGVGGYASASLLMLLGRYDYVPVDSWARTLVSREWYGGQPVGEVEVEAAFDTWGKYKGLVYWFWNWKETS